MKASLVIDTALPIFSPACSLKPSLISTSLSAAGAFLPYSVSSPRSATCCASASCLLATFPVLVTVEAGRASLACRSVVPRGAQCDHLAFDRIAKLSIESAASILRIARAHDHNDPGRMLVVRAAGRGRPGAAFFYSFLLARKHGLPVRIWLQR